MDAGALDDLNLDDMFADDMLFEGLDIELDGMGDIMKDDKKNSTPRPTATVRRGPKTQRTNPMLEKAKAEEAANNKGRRKTKRKPKIPVAFGDDDEDYLEDGVVPPRKKTRKAAARKGKAESVPAPATTKKTKKRKADAGGIPTPKGKKTGIPSLARGSATVAAAGQFGGRLKRGSAAGTPKSVKRKLKGVTESLGTPPANQSALASMGAKPPKPESTFGGLSAGGNQFYPFLESVPLEATLKNRKIYPAIDRIATTLNSSLNATKTEPAEVSPEASIVKLLFETYESVSEKEKQAFTEDKKLSMLSAIPTLRTTIRSLEKSRLLGDLYAMCGLLTRQHNFLQASLDNMEKWCKREFTKDDYDATYAKAKSPPTNPLMKVRWGVARIKVKVVCSGFKEPKGAQQLMAVLPAYAIDPKVQKGVLKKKVKRDRPTVGTTVPQVPEKPKSYAESAPQDRRQRILERVAKLALDLERQEREAQLLLQSSQSAAGSGVGSAKKSTVPGSFVVPEEEPALHTARMWEFIQAAGFYNVPKENQLQILQTPEIHPRGIFLQIPTKIQGRALTQPTNRDDGEQKVSSNSLFDRLQALLVDENVEDVATEATEREDDDASIEEDDDGDEVSLGFLDEDEDDLEGLDVADLSQLSLEERTFLQLSRVGLIRKSLFPMVELVLSGDSEEKCEDDMVNVIGEMSNDLSELTKRNNSRMSFLEATVTRLGLRNEKVIADEQASIIHRCQNLLKRNKEKAKKSNKQKKDDLGLPW